jgi:hypothetical protein
MPHRQAQPTMLYQNRQVVFLQLLPFFSLPWQRHARVSIPSSSTVWLSTPSFANLARASGRKQEQRLVEVAKGGELQEATSGTRPAPQSPGRRSLKPIARHSTADAEAGAAAFSKDSSDNSSPTKRALEGVGGMPLAAVAAEPPRGRRPRERREQIRGCALGHRADVAGSIVGRWAGTEIPIDGDQSER